MTERYEGGDYDDQPPFFDAYENGDDYNGAIDETDITYPDDDPSGLMAEGEEQDHLNEPSYDELLLPPHDNDFTWIAQHGGNIEVQTNPADKQAEVVKIYRSPTSVIRTATVTLPSGQAIQVGCRDIIQVYTRNEQGDLVTDVPDSVVQVNSSAPLLPPGYSVEIEPLAVEAELQSAMEELLDAPPPPLPQEGTITPENAVLSTLSALTTAFTRSTATHRALSEVAVPFEVPSGNPDNPNEILIHYPFIGGPIHIVPPSGILLSGHTRDVVELQTTTQDGGYVRVGRESLASLGERPGYMVIRTRRDPIKRPKA